MNLPEIVSAKSSQNKLSMVTCYDHWSAVLLNETSVDILLVGDSAGMVMHGYSDTIPVTNELMCTHVAAVRKGAPKKFIVADLPFLAFRSDLATNMNSVRALMQAGAHAVKLEGFDGNGELIRHLVQSGIPVMGHLGLTPQFVNMLGGFRVLGRREEQGRMILEQAGGLETAGCFSVVLECIPGGLAKEITSTLKIPTIGIGGGSGCDGQVLVLHDLLGFNKGFKPKFLRQYLNGAELVQAAIEKFCADVKGGQFPSEAETYE
jgi:3-methyl-2-oxobutanoate hydroxymethyltransferase